MAHYAKIENGIVTKVIVADGPDWCEQNLGGEWIQTSYNNRIRKQYAGIGFTYDADADQFVAPQPYSSWTLDDNNDWQAPTAKPNDGKMYEWVESSLAWVEVAI